MSFSNDEQLLNSINLDSVQDYAKYLEMLRPILTNESGYEEFANPNYQPGLDQLRAGRSYWEEQLRKDQQFVDKYKDSSDLSAEDSKALADAKRRIGEITGPEGAFQVLDNEIKTYQSTTPEKSLRKTAERTELEGRFKKIQDVELRRIEEELAFWDSDEGKKINQQQRDLVKSQGELSAKQLERQKWALSGDFKSSDVLNKQIQDEFNKFKDAQARAGNVIMGDDPTTAIAKGTAAQQALGVFQDNIKTATQRERDSIIQGEQGLTQSGLNLSSGLASGALNFSGPGPWTGRTAAYSGAMPGTPNYGGVSGMAVQGHQPYQFDKQLQFNYDQLAASRKRGSGTSGLIGSMAGAGLGALLAAPTGGMSIPMGMMMGSQFGGAAGLMF